MSSNMVILIGNVGKNVEQRYTPGGTAVLNFSLAINKRWTGSDGQTQEKTVWVKCAFFGERAEKIAPWITQGKQIQVVGELEAPDAYINNQGSAAAQNKVTVRDITLLGGGNGNGNGNADPGEVPQGNGQPEVNEADIPF